MRHRAKSCAKKHRRTEGKNNTVVLKGLAEDLMEVI